MPHIEHWLFDLDDTIYPASSGLFRHVSARITHRISELLGLPEDAARGRAARLLAQVRHLAARPHGRARRRSRAVPRLRARRAGRGRPGARSGARAPCCAPLPGQRHVFTNGPSEFAERVLARLGVRDVVHRTCSTFATPSSCPSPIPMPYVRALARLGATRARIVLVDDAPQNIAQARAPWDWRTVWLRSPHSVAGGSAGQLGRPRRRECGRCRGRRDARAAQRSSGRDPRDCDQVSDRHAERLRRARGWRPAASAAWRES